jgi:hypothetical protein
MAKRKCRICKRKERSDEVWPGRTRSRLCTECEKKKCKRCKKKFNILCLCVESKTGDCRVCGENEICHSCISPTRECGCGATLGRDRIALGLCVKCAASIPKCSKCSIVLTGDQVNKGICDDCGYDKKPVQIEVDPFAQRRH